MSASVFTITAMSIDRYLAIRHPMAFRKVFNRKSTIFVSASSYCVRVCVCVCDHVRICTVYCAVCVRARARTGVCVWLIYM